MTPVEQIPAKSMYRFYAAEISYFSGKVRPALRYKRLPFVEILPTPEVYRQVIMARTGLAFIPVIVTPENETLQDTSDILDTLEQRFPNPPLYPTTPVQRVTAHLWELYADEFLVLPAMHYRWSFPEGERKARADFAAATGDVEQANHFADRMQGSIAMLGVLPASISGIEAHTHQLFDLLSAHFSAHGFLLGDRMSLADCALMGPFYAHLYLDAVPGRLMREKAVAVCHWIERMNHPDLDSTGEWLDGDALADTLRPLLELIGRDAVPMILDSVQAFEQWADSRSPEADEPPRAVGMHQTQLRSVSFERYTSAYTLWMVQRSLDTYQSLPAAERVAVDRALAGTGCEALFAFKPRHRLGKRHFKLVFVD